MLFPKTFFLVERHALTTRAAAMVRARILKCHYPIETLLLLLVKNKISLSLSLSLSKTVLLHQWNRYVDDS